MLINSILRQYIIHADLHIGNVIFLEEGKLGIIDFGYVLKFDKNFSDKIFKFYKFLFNKQIKKLTNGTLAWEVTSQESIPLRENYEDHFNATFKTSRESKQEVTITLPNADYQKTRREVGEMDMEKKSGSNIIVKTVKMYSDIYVHI